ncbi:MAG: universal stress protein [Chlorobium sp.]|uniref:universal stress protein n=1 Tax=Chlorobium sp. TaxID=1095 RepID=UPI0025C2DE2C|nr:universal stress protein [Chlorobium sp.]MCF8384016.1 universal stress protein [Chlorobium sp.]
MQHQENRNRETPPKPERYVIKSIAVGIDCSPHSMASLKAAAELAARMNAELIGIFVEDINLLRIADLPFSQEIRLYSAQPESMSTAELERLLRMQARQAETSLQHEAEIFRVHHTFNVRRGIVPREVIAAALEADLLVLGRSGRSPTCRKGLGSTARSALSGSTKNVMLMRTGFSAEHEAILVLFDGSEGSKAALRIALSLVRSGNTLHILILPQTENEKATLEKELSKLIPSGILRVEYHMLPSVTDSRIIARYIRMADSGLLVLSDHMNLPQETVHSLINEVDYPVLLVRNQSS